MLYTKSDEGTCVGRGLCESIKLLTEQRLAFDTRMDERARASDARPLSPNANRHGGQISYGKETEATHSLSEPSRDIRLTQQSTGMLMSKEARVTYMKLRGDQLLHLAEMARHDGGVSNPQCEGLAAEALEAYLAAQQEASSKVNGSKAAANIVNSSSNNNSGNSSENSSTLPEIHPLQVELALRISSVLLHLLDRPIEAWGVAYPAYLAAAEHPTRLGARGLAITQALRDHLACIDIQQGAGGQQHEARGNNDHTNTCHDSSSATTHGQGTARGTGEDGHGEGLVEGEWGFLRMSAECDETRGQEVGDGRTASYKLRTLAKMKKARVCMEAVTSTERVLLGTMERADIAESALKQFFFAYTKKYAKPAQDWSENTKNLSVQGRKAMPQAYLRQGPFLSWAGFEAVCQDFHIITTPTASVAGPAPPDPRPLDNHHQTHQPVRGTPLDHQSPSKASSGASASKKTRHQDGRVFSVEASSGLLSGVQVCIAFVSSCTHRSMVASFPNDGKGDGVVSGENAKRDRMSCGSSAEEKERMSYTGEDAAYWRGMERVVLAGSAALEASSTPGLNFRQFVDALARCGLLGFSSKYIGGTRTFGGRFGGGIGVTGNESQFISAAERVQAIFITQMRLLDSQQVDARLQQLVRLPSANHEGGASEEENKLEGIKQGNTRGNAAGRGHGGKNKGKHTARGTAGGLRGGNTSRKAAAAGPKPATALAPIQTTPRERETIA